MRHRHAARSPRPLRRAVTTLVGLALALSGAACDVLGGGGGGDGGCSGDGACAPGFSCVSSQCVVGERCGAILCDAGQVCDTDACVASPYDQDYVLIAFSGHSQFARPLGAYVSVGGTRVLSAPGTAEATTDVVWNSAATVTIGAAQPLEVTLFETGAHSLFDQTFRRVPYELLRDGELMVGDDSLNVMLRAWPVGAVPECLLDVECAGGEHCQDRVCATGDRCGGAICGDGELCGDGACVENTFGAPYTLTLVGTKLASGQWDTGFDGTPDPQATVLVDGAVVLEGPEQVDTYEATWNVGVTQVFDPYAELRVKVVDVDIQGGDLAIDVTFPRFPYALVRDGALTVTQNGSSVTLSLAR